MKKQTSPLAKKTDAANPFLNAAILAAVALTVLPAAIFGAALRSAPNAESASAAASATEPSRVFAFFIRR